VSGALPSPVPGLPGLLFDAFPVGTMEAHDHGAANETAELFPGLEDGRHVGPLQEDVKKLSLREELEIATVDPVRIARLDCDGQHARDRPDETIHEPQKLSLGRHLLAVQVFELQYEHPDLRSQGFHPREYVLEDRDREELGVRAQARFTPLRVEMREGQRVGELHRESEVVGRHGRVLCGGDRFGRRTRKGSRCRWPLCIPGLSRTGTSSCMCPPGAWKPSGNYT
jgi:hypothetical protein